VQHFLKGGVVMWPMLGLGFAALVVGLIRWFQLSRVRLATEKDLQDVLEELDKGGRKAARRRAEAIAGPAGEMLVTGVDHLDEKKEYIEEVLYEKMLLTKPKLEALLPFIALTAASAPLLGLLGTVTGMISTFNLISLFGTGDPKTMSSGISEALITTEFGLYIAIPSLMLHAFLSRKAKGVLGGMEQTAVGFINGLPEQQFEQL
jgi:biopolymer transport protein ExbB